MQDKDTAPVVRDEDRTCPVCHATLVRRPSEVPANFRLRRSCGGPCARALARLALIGAIPPAPPRGKRPMRECAWCGERYEASHAKQRCCSHPCSSRLAHAERRQAGLEPELPRFTCERCGVEFRPVRGQDHRRFCSPRCAYDARRGKPAWNKSEWVDVVCGQCGEPFSVPPASASVRKFCSYRCRNANQMRQKRNEVTWIERDVYEALERLGVAFERQARIGRFRVDAFVRDRNLVIECNGDFWHCNPDVYPDGPSGPVQEFSAPFGRRRVDWLRANGYRVAVLWERDIRREGAEPLVRRALDDTPE